LSAVVESQCQRSGQELGKAPWPTGARSFLKLPHSHFTVFVRSFPRCQVGLHRKESAGALGGRRPGAVTLPCEICLRSCCSSRDPCNVVCYDQTTTCVHPKSDYLNHDDSAPISNSHGSLSDVGIVGRCVCAYTCLRYRVTILLVVAVCLPSSRSGGKGGRGRVAEALRCGVDPSVPAACPGTRQVPRSIQPINTDNAEIRGFGGVGLTPAWPNVCIPFFIVG
jgi:hypothetical protein